MNIEFSRSDRVAALLQTEIAKFIQLDIQDSALPLITITGVNISADLSYAKIYFVTHNDEKSIDALKRLKNAIVLLRKQIAKNLNLRIVPKLCFFYDKSISRSRHIDRLLND